MIYRTLTDIELRRQLADPNNTQALAEAAWRFENGSKEMARLQEDIEDAEAEIERLEELLRTEGVNAD